ncbi:MAG TPA: hypothetical protein VGO73_07245, partial [Pyrinomonadaceae bacterium]|nr:hypothetical protein [Pyrinomonadaceae bacterium]
VRLYFSSCLPDLGWLRISHFTSGPGTSFLPLSSLLGIALSDRYRCVRNPIVVLDQPAYDKHPNNDNSFASNYLVWIPG